MSNKFIAAIVATALTVTSIGTTSAQAQQYQRNDARGEAVLGIAALVAMGLLIHNSKKDKRTHTSTRQHKPYVARPPKRNKAHRKHLQPRPVPKRVSRYTLPQQCLRRVETHRGMRNVMAERCLERNYGSTHRLPNHCATRFETRRGNVKYGYRLRCLERDGYRLSRR